MMMQGIHDGVQQRQQVLIKNPRSLVGTVLRERPGGASLPVDERRYLVPIEAEERLFFQATLKL